MPKKYGYGFLYQAPPPPKEAPHVDTDAYQLVFIGLRHGEHPAPFGLAVSPGKVGGLTVPPGGCLGAAAKQIYGNETNQPDGANCEYPPCIRRFPSFP